jgi:asparagine synthase (glutamine-hydrolysing)
MCGIAGIATIDGKAIESSLVDRMTDILEHRGPDDRGTYLSHADSPNARMKVGLGHRRLSIIDIEGGRQPMSNEERSIWIVYNGETYNFKEEREALKSKGYKFRTASDTEVVLRLYEEYGIECLERMRGMFAFAIWDAKKERLFLSRDRVGQKPLFYYHKNGGFLFASEIKAILESRDVKRKIDYNSLDEYLTYGYPAPPRTMYEGIRKLEPGSYLTYNRDGVKIKRYWKLSYGEKADIGEGEAAERLYGLLGDATRMRLISDVPLGAFLSGGVDSSAIVALMAKHSNEKVKTFSIGFSEAAFSELKYAREISERFGTEHKELIVKPDALDCLPKLAWHYDQPFGDSSAIPTYYVSKMTKEFVTVALNGDGGDEAFSGYHRYRGAALAGSLMRMPKGLLKAAALFTEGAKSGPAEHAQRFLKGIIENRDIEGAYADWLNYFPKQEKAKVYTERVRALVKENNAEGFLRESIASSDARDLVEKIIGADVSGYLPEDLLVKVDIATMANSLEGRSPFLDHKVMEFAASLPLSYKMRGNDKKRVLKEAFRKDIPPSFMNRRKKGFGIPVGEWFRGELKSFIREMLLDKDSIKREIFSPGYITSLIDAHQSGRADHTQRLYALLSFELWHRTFIDKRPI